MALNQGFVFTKVVILSLRYEVLMNLFAGMKFTIRIF